MPPFFILLLFIAALVIFSSKYILFRQLLKLALQYPSYKTHPLSAAPAELKQLAEPAIAQLQSLGFHLTAACEITPLIYQAGCPEWEIILEQNGSFAHIALRHPLEAYAPTKVTFYSFLQNGHLLLTLNGEAHGLIGELPATTIADAYSPNLSTQWQHHCQLIENSNAPVHPLRMKRYSQQLIQHFCQYLQHLQQQGSIQTVPLEQGQPQLFQLSIITALICCKNITLKAGKAATLTKALAQTATQSHHAPDPANPASANVLFPPELPLNTQVQSFQRMQRMERGSLTHRTCDRWLFFASLILFMVSFRQMFDPVGLLIFVGAIAFHEGGHHWAMRYFGYQNTTIFFLPFLGAAATGHKDQASLFEKVCVLLAGPLPGVLLGSGLLWLSNSLTPGLAEAITHEASLILLGLNLFNLLPIYPLDGGKIVHLLFFSRFPYWDVLFKVSAVLILALLSLFSPIFLLLAVLVAISIPSSQRSANIHLALQRNNHTTASPQDYLQQIFLHQREQGYQRLPFNQRYNLTKELWERRSESKAKWPTYVSLSLLYLTCLLGAPTGLMMANAGSAVPIARDNSVHPSITYKTP